MKANIQKNNFNNIYTVINGLFVNCKGKHISQYVRISAREEKITFEYFNEKDYLSIYFESEVKEEGSVVIGFEILKIIKSLNGEIEISSNSDNGLVTIKDSKKKLNIPTIDIEFELQHPFGDFSSVELNACKFIDDVKYLKNLTKDADVKQDRFKNILMHSKGNKRFLIAATGHMVAFLENKKEDDLEGKIYIPRSISGCLNPLKSLCDKEDVIKLYNYETYYTKLEFKNIIIHSSYETKEFVNYGPWANVEVPTAVVIKKKELSDCLNSLLLLKPILDKIEFSVVDKYLNFHSIKNSEIEMKAKVDINKGKNIEKYFGNFSGKEIKSFIGRASNDDDVIMGMNSIKGVNIIKIKDAKLVSHMLTMKGA